MFTIKKILVTLILPFLLIAPNALLAAKTITGLDLNNYRKTHQALFEFEEEYKQQVFSYTGEKSNAHIKRKIHIAVVHPTVKGTSYWPHSNEVYQKYCLNRSMDCQFYFYDRKSENRLIDERRFIYALVTTNLDYLIYTLDSPDQHKIIDIILQDYPQTQVLLQNITQPIIEWEKHPPLIYAGFNHYEGSKNIADYYNKKITDTTQVNVLMENKGRVSQTRVAGFIDNLNSNFIVNNIYIMEDQSTKMSIIDELKKEGSGIIYSTSKDIALSLAKDLNGKSEQFHISGWGCFPLEINLFEEKKSNDCLFGFNDDVPVAIIQAIEWNELGKTVPLVFEGRFLGLDQKATPSIIP